MKTTTITLNEEQVKTLKDLLNQSSEGKFAISILGLDFVEYK